jgi:hypothetical protein
VAALESKLGRRSQAKPVGHPKKAHEEAVTTHTDRELSLYSPAIHRMISHTRIAFAYYLC